GAMAGLAVRGDRGGRLNNPRALPPDPQGNAPHQPPPRPAALPGRKEMASSAPLRQRLLLAVAIAAAPPALAPEPSSAGLEFFEKKIRPVLVEHCYQCHSAKKSRGGLRLDSRDGLRKGGDSGPALASGKPEASLLLEVLRYHGRDQTPKMPPK